MLYSAFHAPNRTGAAVTLESTGKNSQGFLVVGILQFPLQFRYPLVPVPGTLSFLRQTVQLFPLEGVIERMLQVVAQMAPDETP